MTKRTTNEDYGRQVPTGQAAQQPKVSATAVYQGQMSGFLLEAFVATQFELPRGASRVLIWAEAALEASVDAGNNSSVV